MDKIKAYIKNNRLLCILIFISIILHTLAIFDLGITYNINSDDMSYVNSGITFKNELIISMHSEYPSAQIMPGLTYLIGLISFIFGEGQTLWTVLKILWAIFGTLSLIGIFKTVQYLLKDSKYKNICAFITGLLLLTPSFLWMDNIILTETPFMFGFIYIIYFTIKEANEHKKTNFIFITLLYLFCTLLKANFAIYPIILIIYLLIKNYDKKLLLKEILIAASITLVFFIPWTYRNYKEFNKFIPLTYGSGNPLLLGTYQGYGYPSDEEIDLNYNLQNKMTDELKDFFKGKIEPKLERYYYLEIDKINAEYRMQQWWKKDKISMLVSYGILKPIELFGAFYWDEIFGLNNKIICIIRIVELMCFAIAIIILLFKKQLNKEILFILLTLLINIMIYSYTFTFSRYGQTLMFLLFIIIGVGLNSVLSLKTNSNCKTNVKFKFKA